MKITRAVPALIASTALAIAPVAPYVLIATAPSCASVELTEALTDRVQELDEEIAPLEAKERAGTITPAEVVKLTDKRQERENVATALRTTNPTTGPGLIVGWVTRILTGDVRAIGEATAAAIATAVGSKAAIKARKRRQQQAGAAPGAQGSEGAVASPPPTEGEEIGEVEIIAPPEATPS